LLEITELSGADFAACFAIRVEVFVNEQNVPLAEERDALDEGARHFLARLDGVPVGTLRLLESAAGEAKITRVAVVKAARGKGVGEALMRHAEAATDAAALTLDAQTHALAFYEKLGFAAYGAPFMEAGIAHRQMRKLRQPQRGDGIKPTLSSSV
jgi:ElaA protein